MADEGVKLFGFEIKRSKKKEEEKTPSIVPPRDDEGGSYATASGSHYGQYLNLGDDDSKDNYQLIMKYRGNAMHPEVDAAIEDIVNESITGSELKQTLELNLDNVKTTDSIKKFILEEFDSIYNMLNFKELGHDIFRRWYIDGRIFHHLVVNETNPKEGIIEIRPIDSAKMRKVKKVKKKKDPATGADIIEKTEEFFIFQEKPGSSSSGVKMTNDSVSYVTSGLLSEDRKRIISYMHKALKPINQLRMMEDALVIYRLSRAPERRVFYVDVGNMPRGKAEEYLKSIMAKYRNKLVYDAATGQIKDDRKHMSMLEDFWLPRREGGKGTEITTLPGGENLGQIDDVIYFQRRMYRSLNVPQSRLETENSFSLGRSNEISRDELKFQKFIDRLRMRFAHLFYGILKKQLIIKGICTEQDWEEWKGDITVDYIRDNHFTELRDLDVLRERIQTLDQVQNYVGDYYSKEWVQKNILMLSDEEIDNMKKQIEGETEEAPDDDEEPQQQQQQDQSSGQNFELKPVGDEQ
jgi:hypothetical protein